MHKNSDLQITKRSGEGAGGPKARPPGIGAFKSVFHTEESDGSRKSGPEKKAK